MTRYKLQVDMDPKTRAQYKMAAITKDMSLSDWVRQALKEKLEKQRKR